jgi:hypothetical protein
MPKKLVLTLLLSGGILAQHFFPSEQARTPACPCRIPKAFPVSGRLPTETGARLGFTSHSGRPCLLTL